MNQSTDAATLRFYKQEAERYCQRAGSVPSPALSGFLSLLKPGATILELGCGSGRDTIEMLRQGYDVTPTDGSPEMAHYAERLLNRPVMVLEFSEIGGDQRFDGVWAHACLLHIPIAGLCAILRRIYAVLKVPRVLFANFKEGTSEGRDRLGRHYNYPSLATLEAIFRHAAPWSVEIETTAGHGYDGAAIQWLNCTAKSISPKCERH
jgi:SAM-dependent methyltransferase